MVKTALEAAIGFVALSTAGVALAYIIIYLILWFA